MERGKEVLRWERFEPTTYSLTNTLVSHYFSLVQCQYTLWLHKIQCDTQCNAQCVCVCLCVHHTQYKCMHVHTHVHTRMHARTHAHTHTQTYPHTHTHTHQPTTNPINHSIFTLGLGQVTLDLCYRGNQTC